MFGRVREPGCDGLPTSRLLDQNDFYDVFMHDLRRARQEVVIESPFLSIKRINYFLPTLHMLIRHRVNIIINTKSPEEHEPEYRDQVELCIGQLQEIGISVLLTGGHHRKLAIIDQHTLYEGSLNILSQNDSCEIMRRIDSEQLAQQMIEFIGVHRFTR